MARAGELGVGQSLSFLREVDAINCRAGPAWSTWPGSSPVDPSAAGVVAVLGAAFKPDTDDVRDSPALDVARTIDPRGADVSVYDPKAIDKARRIHPELRLRRFRGRGRRGTRTWCSCSPSGPSSATPIRNCS